MRIARPWWTPAANRVASIARKRQAEYRCHHWRSPHHLILRYCAGEIREPFVVKCMDGVQKRNARNNEPFTPIWTRAQKMIAAKPSKLKLKHFNYANSHTHTTLFSQSTAHRADRVYHRTLRSEWCYAAFDSAPRTYYVAVTCKRLHILIRLIRSLLA